MEKLVRLLDDFNRDLSPFAGETKYTIWDDSVELAKYLIENDVRPVVHGWWFEGDLLHRYSCSCCNVRQDKTSAYCPSCGAKMDLEE